MSPKLSTLLSLLIFMTGVGGWALDQIALSIFTLVIGVPFIMGYLLFQTLPLGFYRRVFPTLYAEAEREHEIGRQRLKDERNWEWIIGPDPFDTLPKDLRDDFDLDVLLGGDKVKEAHQRQYDAEERERAIKEQIDENRERIAATHHVSPAQIGPSAEEIVSNIKGRGPGCAKCGGSGLLADMWQGARACDECSTFKQPINTFEECVAVPNHYDPYADYLVALHEYKVRQQKTLMALAEKNLPVPANLID